MLVLSLSLTFGPFALHGLVQGYGYEVTRADVWLGYWNTMQAAQTRGNLAEVRDHIRQSIGREGQRGFVTSILGRDLGL